VGFGHTELHCQMLREHLAASVLAAMQSDGNPLYNELCASELATPTGTKDAAAGVKGAAAGVKGAAAGAKQGKKNKNTDKTKKKKAKKSKTEKASSSPAPTSSSDESA
jgi:hypothetical protein